MVEINLVNGYVTRYPHNEQNPAESRDRANKDQVIALSGSVGRSTGPHVHLEVLHNGKFVNPRRFINQGTSH